MPTVDVVNSTNQKAGSVELDASVFETEVKTHLLHAEVRRQLASRRAGSASTKNRHAVSGGGAKPHRQKGTGRARQGSIRSPQYKGGGVVFGPVPRKYDHKLTKKMRSGALRSALSHRQAEGDLIVVDELAMDEYKTRSLVALLEILDCGSSALLVVSAEVPQLVGSAKNLPYVDVIQAAGLNVHAVLAHRKLVFTQAAIEQVNARLGTGTPTIEGGGE